MVNVSPQILLLLVSIGISFLVLMGQRQTAIRDSIAQLDDRQLEDDSLKVRTVVHEVRFFYGVLPKLTSPISSLRDARRFFGKLRPPRQAAIWIWRTVSMPWATHIAFRVTEKGDYSGISDPIDLREPPNEYDKEFRANEDVVYTYLLDKSKTTNAYGIFADEPVTEKHTEIVVVVRSINPVLCREVSDRGMTALKAADRVRSQEED